MAYIPAGNTANFMGIQQNIEEQYKNELLKKQIEKQAEQAKIGQILQGAQLAASLGMGIGGMVQAGKLAEAQKLHELDIIDKEQSFSEAMKNLDFSFTRGESALDRQHQFDVLNSTQDFTRGENILNRQHEFDFQGRDQSFRERMKNLDFDFTRDEREASQDHAINLLNLNFAGQGDLLTKQGDINAAAAKALYEHQFNLQDDQQDYLTLASAVKYAQDRKAAERDYEHQFDVLNSTQDFTRGENALNRDHQMSLQDDQQAFTGNQNLLGREFQRDIFTRGVEANKATVERAAEIAEDAARRQFNNEIMMLWEKEELPSSVSGKAFQDAQTKAIVERLAREGDLHPLLKNQLDLGNQQVKTMIEEALARIDQSAELHPHAVKAAELGNIYTGAVTDDLKQSTGQRAKLHPYAVNAADIEVERGVAGLAEHYANEDIRRRLLEAQVDSEGAKTRLVDAQAYRINNPIAEPTALAEGIAGGTIGADEDTATAIRNIKAANAALSGVEQGSDAEAQAVSRNLALNRLEELAEGNLSVGEAEEANRILQALDYESGVRHGGLLEKGLRSQGLSRVALAPLLSLVHKDRQTSLNRIIEELRKQQLGM
jgi:hypothetical protein